MFAAIAVMAAIGLTMGAILGWASVRLRVEDDPLVEKIDAILPQTQCGQC
ncbi:MAG TPA: electron transport complex subunit RsxB, partial [Thiobacillaceae bacterium]|nr:electron transport complex subunit RsxB [Thiobacillaceae bacterium]